MSSMMSTVAAATFRPGVEELGPFFLIVRARRARHDDSSCPSSTNGRSFDVEARSSGAVDVASVEVRDPAALLFGGAPRQAVLLEDLTLAAAMRGKQSPVQVAKSATVPALPASLERAARASSARSRILGANFGWGTRRRYRGPSCTLRSRRCSLTRFGRNERGRRTSRRAGWLAGAPGPERDAILALPGGPSHREAREVHHPRVPPIRRGGTDVTHLALPAEVDDGREVRASSSSASAPPRLDMSRSTREQVGNAPAEVHAHPARMADLEHATELCSRSRSSQYRAEFDRWRRGLGLGSIFLDMRIDRARPPRSHA